ncbi:MAG: hypothetical protein QW587_08650 [Candidatus Bathyarchaeia archaeon]
MISSRPVDWVCGRLVEVLRRGSKIDLDSLMGEADFARQTVSNHLKHLGLCRNRPCCIG